MHLPFGEFEKKNEKLDRFNDLQSVLKIYFRENGK